MESGPLGRSGSTGSNPGIGPGIDIDLFVIGAMKAATTSLCDWLGHQPGVAMSQPKEPGIFNTDADLASWAGRTHTLFDHASPPAVRVDGSTFYAKYPTISGVPQRVRQHCPDARFVYVMRHPVERLLSQYHFDYLRGVTDLRLPQALDQVTQLVDNSRYALQLRQWREAFGADRFLLVFAERFGADPAAQVERVLRFVDVPPEHPLPAPGEGHANRTDAIMRASAARRLLRTSSLGRAVRPYVPANLVKAYRDRAHRRSAPQLDEEQRHRLEEVFDADLRELTEMTGGPGITCASWHDVVGSWTPALRER